MSESSRSLAVFCHVFTAGWREPLQDLIDAFNAADLTNETLDLHLGIVGPEIGRDAVEEFVLERCDLHPVLEAYAREGNEALTINAVHAWAQERPDGAVLYTHTKGASRPMPLNTAWREAMIDALVPVWEWALGELERHDAVGSFWVTAEEQIRLAGVFPGVEGFFGGNFWMARNEYLADLGECGPYPRYQAEEWIGRGTPKVLDVQPGYPGYDYFGLAPPV